MNKEEVIRTYTNTHNSRDNVVYTWIMWNFDKLQKIWNNDKLFCDHNLYEELEKEAYKDQFVVIITNNGKYRATTPNIVENTSNCRTGSDKEINWNEP